MRLTHLLCLLLHRKQRGPWLPVGFADWWRVVRCRTCGDSWLEWR